MSYLSLVSHWFSFFLTYSISDCSKWTNVQKERQLQRWVEQEWRRRGQDNHMTICIKELLIKTDSLSQSCQYVPSQGLTHQGKCIKHLACRWRCAGHSCWHFHRAAICQWRLDLSWTLVTPLPQRQLSHQLPLSPQLWYFVSVKYHLNSKWCVNNP